MYKIEYFKPSELTPYFNNPRKNDAAVLKVAESIQAFGFQNPIIVDKEMTIIAGHTRFKAALKLDLKTVPVIITDLSEEKAKAYRIADNRLGEFAEWDWEQLDVEMEDFSDEMKALLDFEIPDLFEPVSGLIDDDEVPEVEEATCKPGDLWKLGEHRLLCGDATNTDDVERLMNGHKADMVFTDPPYNVDYGSSKNLRHKIRTIKNDKQNPQEWNKFNKNLAMIFKNYCNGDIYVWGASGPDGMKQRLTFYEEGIHWSATIIWKKQQFVLSPAKYQRIYEPCFYGWNDKSSYCGNRKQTEVWEVDRPLNSKLHPTMKPVELIIKAIKNSSKKGMIVYDSFLGSGSTLIACEKTNRKCYGMEIDPHYCDVIIKRWEDFTGNKAELQNG